MCVLWAPAAKKTPTYSLQSTSLHEIGAHRFAAAEEEAEDLGPRDELRGARREQPRELSGHQSLARPRRPVQEDPAGVPQFECGTQVGGQEPRSLFLVFL